MRRSHFIGLKKPRNEFDEFTRTIRANSLQRIYCLALMAVGILAACQRAPAPTLAPEPSPTLTAPPTAALVSVPTLPPVITATAFPPTSTPLPIQPRVFTIGLAAAPGTLDPANAVDESALLITRHLYEGITRFAPGTTTVAPALAERWETSADGLTWTFHLRSNILFSDGTPLTAEIARRNVARWLNREPPGRYAFWQLMFGGFAGETDETGAPLSNLIDAQAPDETTLVLTLRRPDAALPNTLAMPSFALVNPMGWAGGTFGQPGAPSAGTGPFVLAQWTVEGVLQLTRLPGYWGTPATPDELVFKIIPDDTQRLLALRAGEVEGMATVNPSDYATVKSDPTLRLEFSPGLSVLYLGFNRAHAPWAVRECRLAVAFALNPFRYFQDWFPNDAHVATSIVPQEMWGYASAESDRQQDSPTAQSLWQTCLASGVSVPLTMTLYVPPIARDYLPDPAGLGAAIQADLAAVSITVQIESPDWQTQWLPDVQSGRADLFLLGWTGVNGDADSALCPLFCGANAMFNSDSNGAPLPPDAELADWLRQAQASTDIAERERLYALAQARVWNDAIVIPLTHRDSAWAFRANVAGSAPSPIEATFFTLDWIR